MPTTAIMRGDAWRYMGINNMGDAREAQPSKELKCDSGAEAQPSMRLKRMWACDHIRSEQGAG